MAIRSVQSLLDSDRDFEYLPFYGMLGNKVGSKTDKGCFSQWYTGGSFEVCGVEFLTTEDYMMRSKALLFNDLVAHDRMLEASHPRDVKVIGRQVKNFDPVVWEENAFDIVVMGNILKFSQNPWLNRFLQSTGDKVLVEASPYDKIWGIGIGERHQDVCNPAGWDGTNLLGFALMEVRQRLRPMNSPYTL